MITGQIRHRRKLTKSIFFVDIQPKEGPKSQVFFRTDDQSLDPVDFQDAFRACKPGHVVQLEIMDPLDPSEAENKDFPVWQSARPVQVILPYADREGFIQDRALGSVGQVPLRLGDGTKKEKGRLICKYWINKNKCEKGQDCPFQHPTGDAFEKARTQWLQQKITSKKIANFDPNDPHTSKKPHGIRAIIFADWIQKTFKDLNGIVLDVAGGKGDLAMILSRGFGIPSVVVEPNQRNLPNYWYTRLRRLLYRFETGHLGQPDWKSQAIQIHPDQWPYPITPTYLHTLLDDAFLIHHADLISQVGLFLGLHADQATIPIVEAALKAQKPFAVVPCCVFSHQHRDRRLRSGELVTTTEQQIQYICEMRPPGEIKTAYLDFEGKNVVVYWNKS